MIDTVRLTLPLDQFSIVKPELFSPQAGVLNEPLGNRTHIKCFQNPTKQDLKSNRYKPKLALTKRFVKGGTSITLTIEFSAPKLLFFGSNFDELKDSDFAPVIKLLVLRVREMGIQVTEESLRQAKVSAIHFSKNITFLDYTTVTSLLKHLEKIDLTRRLDVNQTKFRNGGSAVYYYSKSHCFVLYDKVQDIRQPKGRGIENDEYPSQMDIFDEIRRAHKEPLEVLRIEFRLLKSVKIKEVLRKINVPIYTAFEEFFSEKLSQKILTYYWNITLQNLKPILLGETLNSEELLRVILQKNKHTKPSTALQIVGVIKSTTEIGARSFEVTMGKYFNPKTCQRYFDQVYALELPQSIKLEPFNHISKALAEFKPLKMQDLTLPF